MRAGPALLFEPDRQPSRGGETWERRDEEGAGTLSSLTRDGEVAPFALARRLTLSSSALASVVNRTLRARECSLAFGIG